MQNKNDYYYQSLGLAGAYWKETAADEIAKRLNLNRSYNPDNALSGINKNGIYFYNAVGYNILTKIRYDSTAKYNGPYDPELVIKNIEPQVSFDVIPIFSTPVCNFFVTTDLLGTVTERIPIPAINHTFLKIPIDIPNNIFKIIYNAEANRDTIINKINPHPIIEYKVVFKVTLDIQCEDMNGMPVRFSRRLNDVFVSCQGPGTYGIVIYVNRDGFSIQYYYQDFPYNPIRLFNLATIAEVLRAPDIKALPAWDTSGNCASQPNQLYWRTKQALDDFYGKDAWINNPNAVIDLIGYSQGGVVIREMVDKARDPSPSNPVNHINRMVTTNTPHTGSAFATPKEDLMLGDLPNRMRYPAMESLRDKFAGVPEAGGIEINVEETPITGVITNITVSEIISFLIGGRIMLNGVTIGGSIRGPYLGPYSGDMTVRVYGCSIKNPFFPFPLPFVVQFGIMDFNVINKKMLDVQKNLNDMSKRGEVLGWHSDFIEDNLFRTPYPTRPSDGSNIYETHLSAPSVPYFFTTVSGAALKEINMILNTTAVSFWAVQPFLNVAGIAKTAAKTINDCAASLHGDLFLMDTGWCAYSDIVVEDVSQKAVYAGSQFNPAIVDEFKFLEHAQNPRKLIHPYIPPVLIPGLGEFLALSQYKAAAHAGVDIARELGVPGIEQLPNGWTISQLPPCSKDGIMGFSREEATDSVTYSSPAVRIKNATSNNMQGFKAYYYVKADPNLGPQIQVLNSGGAQLYLERIKNNLYRVRIDASSKTLSPCGEFPSSSTQVRFKLSYSSGAAWDRLDDFSYRKTTGGAPEENERIMVETAGKIVSGYNPDTSDALATTIDPAATVMSRERSLYNNISQPSLTFVNTGNTMLKYFKLRYYFTTTNTPQVKSWWRPDMSKSTVSPVHVKDNLWTVDIAYNNMSLKPGQYLENIEFEVYNSDWSAWNFADDPSCIKSDTLQMNGRIVACNSSGRSMWGDVSDVEIGAGIKAVKALSRDESSYDNLSNPRIKLRNTGTATLNNLKVFYYFTAEYGKEPVLREWDVPGCDVQLEKLDSLGNYRLVFTTGTTGFEPGQEWPNSYGWIVGLHYEDWSAWDKTNDYSNVGCSQTYVETDRIVVEDSNGNVLWGARP